MIARIFFPFLLLFLVHSQSSIGCLNHRGQKVDWFVVYTTTSSIHSKFPPYGYLYMDSNSVDQSFDIYNGYGDQSDGPIGRTIAQTYKNQLGSVAWNDQLRAEQGNGNSVKAHSKFYMALSSGKATGFAVVHSIPQYPSFSDKVILPNIADKQKVKAQHQFCLSISDSETAKKLYDNACFMRPNIYQNTLYSPCVKSALTISFLKADYSVGKSTIKAIYKNGDGSISDIFNDGITDLIGSSIVAQTFGSPKAYPPVCQNKFTVGNSATIKIADGISWTQGSDHSKWVYALDNDYSCFGDLNRNTQAQTKRGGAFYCINSKNLNQALRNLTPNPENC